MTDRLRSVARLMVPLVAALVMACGDDPVGTTPPLLPKFENLSQRSNVLNNFELAFNKRNIDRYDQLVDANLVFTYEVYIAGVWTTQQWDRATDIAGNTALFGDAVKLDFDLNWEDGVAWAAIPATDASGETWYTTTVFYYFVIKIGDTTYIANTGSKIEMTIRNAGTSSSPRWQLVKAHDLGEPTVVAVANSTASTEPTTLWQIESLYH